MGKCNDFLHSIRLFAKRISETRSSFFAAHCAQLKITNNNRLYVEAFSRLGGLTDNQTTATSIRGRQLDNRSSRQSAHYVGGLRSTTFFPPTARRAQLPI